ncbi:hypothetical protein BDV38DRAFT_280033 [Aspergillus pseudotamarii]|uniref:Uncharacterized protein n=1 Tax=Aspergillus pseudotamarii TaxID=132259 RepID=A0A5N6T2K7_ASPPS|nr:uncharacterized protein BDV38DRAFT_280033 [Aspergillus pseudotamarii]KAE8140533.1 hypothetical protein BDV38DRAFT_280033 [Aspergillus pseudotamarii]
MSGLFEFLGDLLGISDGGLGDEEYTFDTEDPTDLGDGSSLTGDNVEADTMDSGNAGRTDHIYFAGDSDGPSSDTNSSSSETNSSSSNTNSSSSETNSSSSDTNSSSSDTNSSSSDTNSSSSNTNSTSSDTNSSSSNTNGTSSDTNRSSTSTGGEGIYQQGIDREGNRVAQSGTGLPFYPKTGAPVNPNSVTWPNPVTGTIGSSDTVTPSS